MGMVQEFAEFLKEYKVVGLLVAFTVGTATNDMVKSFVNNIIMPFLAPVMPGESWQELVWALGPVQMRVGSFLAALINFFVIALVVFLLVKQLPAKVKHGK